MNPEDYISLQLRLAIEVALMTAGGIVMRADLRGIFPRLSEQWERVVKIAGTLLFAGGLFALVFEVIVFVAGPVLPFALRALASLIGAGLAAVLLYALSRVLRWLTRRVVEWGGRETLDLPYGFRPVWIGSVVNQPFQEVYDPPLSGRSFLGGVLFEIHRGYPTKGVNNILRTEAGRGYTVDLPPAVRDVRALYLLVNSTNTYEKHRGTQIGQVELVFHKGSFTVPLVIGENVREWCIGHPGTLSRTTDPALKEVRRLVRAKDPTRADAVIDMLKIEVPIQYRTHTLARIQIADEGIGDHRLLICGITCLVRI